MANVLSHKINNSIHGFNEIKNNDVWSSSASSSFKSELEYLIDFLNCECDKIVILNSALEKLDKIKEIDNQIISLSASIITGCESDEQVIEANKKINSSILQLSQTREQYKKEILVLLSSFDIIADISVVLIPDIEGAKVLFEYENGSIYELVNESGLAYQVYIPNEYSSDIPVVIYDAGDSINKAYPNSLSNWELFKDRFSNGALNAVVVRSLREDTSSCYEDIINRLGINSAKPVAISHSGGTSKSSIIEFNDLMQSGKAESGLFVAMDGYTPAWYWDSKGYIDNFKENNVVVIGVVQGDDSGEYAISQKQLAKFYPNVLIMYDKSSYGTSHGLVNTSLTENDVLEYFIGSGQLPDNYEIIRYSPNDPNADSEGFITVDYNDVNSIEKVYEYFDIE